MTTEETPAPKLKKRDIAKSLVWRRPEGMKFDITAGDRVDEATWSLLESLCPSKRVLLQYSTGKDSVAAWWELKERGYTVIPVFKEIFRDMSFFSDPIKAHEDFFGTQVHIVPHKVLYFARMKFFNDIERLARLGVDLKDEILTNCESKSFLKRFRRLTIDALLDEHQCDVTVIGTKASDSLHRRTHFTVDGPYLPSERLLSLVWRLKKNAPFQIMIDNKIPIPRYYLWLGRSPEFVLRHEFYFIKKYYPADYESLRQQLSNMEVFVRQYEQDNKLEHAVLPPKFVIAAHKDGHPFV